MAQVIAVRFKDGLQERTPEAHEAQRIVA